MAVIDLRNRAPSVARLPDLRERITRVCDVLNWAPKTPADILAECWLPWGTVDDQYTSCRLVGQSVAGQPEAFPDASKRPPVLTRIYEEIPANDELIVGEPNVSYDEFGRKTVYHDYLQFSAGTSLYTYTVGTTAAPAPNTACILQKSEQTDDGTLKRTRRWFIDSGLLSQYDEIKNNESLYLRTLVYLNEVPATPSGYTLIDTKVDGVQGLKRYTYTFAKGTGEVSRDIKYNQSSDEGTTGATVTTIRYLVVPAATVQPTALAGSVLISKEVAELDGHRMWTTVWAKGTGEVGREVSYSQSSDAGTTGATITKITHLTATSVSTNPTTGPGGSVLVTLDHREADGYRVWTAVYGSGTGTVSTTTEERHNGGLILKTIRALGSAPTTPSGYTPIDTKVEESEGYKIFTYTFAKGDGQIDTSTEWSQGATEGAETLGVTKQTIRYLTDKTQATHLPATNSGFVLVGSTMSEESGHRLWVTTWAKGLGEVSRDIKYGQSAAGDGSVGTTITTIKTLVAAGGTISPASLAGSVLVGSEFTEEAGYRLWITTWGKGTGLVVDDKTIAQKDALIYYHRVALGSAPTVPTATIGGTVTEIERSERKSDGYVIHDYRWAEGDGESGVEVQGEPDGALVYTVTTTSAAKATPAYPGSGTGYLVRLNQRAEAGHFVNVAVYKKPPATDTFKKSIGFEMPGLASFSGSPPQLVLSPPTNRQILADVEVSYATSQDSSTPFTVSAWASLYYDYIEDADGEPGQQHSDTKGIGGYLAAASSISGSDDYFNGVLCYSYAAALISSVPSARPTGSTVLHVDNDPYLVATDGTVVYRRIKTSYSF